MLQTFAAFSNLSGYPRSGVHDVRPHFSPCVILDPALTCATLYRSGP